MEPTLEKNEQTLASRWSRLLAFLIDSIVLIVSFSPVIWLSGVFDDEDSAQISTAAILTLIVLGYALFFAINWLPLKEQAQTWGKRFLNIKIVGDDGCKLPIKDLIFKRYAFGFGVGFIPVVGDFFVLVNHLFIFTASKKCLHDHVAKSSVVNA
ncbi:RDD family protein [Exilibacterium tricleocarpae]|uniref:RDD family protein n=1 Tax=Exilibacterium tricleocarpae TaxID=2591008 RepID=A0A545U8L2_9GAMM|nr:RDD family protein [Exilibacterium tricleocarpae]TQV85743.1 RDD family protein [Exilibacterium tricleocarpae]